MNRMNIAFIDIRYSRQWNPSQLEVKFMLGFANSSYVWFFLMFCLALERTKKILRNVHNRSITQCFSTFAVFWKLVLRLIMHRNWMLVKSIHAAWFLLSGFPLQSGKVWNLISVFSKTLRDGTWKSILFQDLLCCPFSKYCHFFCFYQKTFRNSDFIKWFWSFSS